MDLLTEPFDGTSVDRPVAADLSPTQNLQNVRDDAQLIKGIAGDDLLLLGHSSIPFTVKARRSRAVNTALRSFRPLTLSGFSVMMVFARA